MAKDSFYFSHDNTAFSDPKIIDLRMKHGMEGYGIFWAILELLHQNGGAMQSQCERIAFALGVHSDMVKSILHDFGLFQFDGSEFYSMRMISDLKDRERISKKASESAIKRWGRANAMRTHSDGNANAMQGKERKGKETKEESGNSLLSETPNPKPIDTMKTETELQRNQRLLMESKIATTLGDAGRPVNSINTEEFATRLRAWMTLYGAVEHRLKLERGYLNAVNRMLDDHPGINPYDQLDRITREYQAYCTANDRRRKDAARWLDDSMYLNSWKIENGQAKNGANGSKNEVFYVQKSKNPDA